MTVVVDWWCCGRELKEDGEGCEKTEKKKTEKRKKEKVMPKFFY
jgi:hypothetical protein